MKLIRIMMVISLSTVICAFFACAAQEASAPMAPAPAPAAAPAAASDIAAPAAPAIPAAAAPAAPQLALAVPSVPKAKPTAVPTPVAKSADVTWMQTYLEGPGYKAAWREPKKGGIMRYGASHKLDGHDPNYGHSFEGPQFLPTYNALLRYCLLYTSPSPRARG